MEYIKNLVKNITHFLVTDCFKEETDAKNKLWILRLIWQFRTQFYNDNDDNNVK
jgi:hypothetical protein